MRYSRHLRWTLCDFPGTFELLCMWSTAFALFFPWLLSAWIFVVLMFFLPLGVGVALWQASGHFARTHQNSAVLPVQPERPDTHHFLRGHHHKSLYFLLSSCLVFIFHPHHLSLPFFCYLPTQPSSHFSSLPSISLLSHPHSSPWVKLPARLNHSSSQCFLCAWSRRHRTLPVTPYQPLCPPPHLSIPYLLFFLFLLLWLVSQ